MLTYLGMLACIQVYHESSLTLNWALTLPCTRPSSYSTSVLFWPQKVNEVCGSCPTSIFSTSQSFKYTAQPRTSVSSDTRADTNKEEARVPIVISDDTESKVKVLCFWDKEGYFIFKCIYLFLGVLVFLAARAFLQLWFVGFSWTWLLLSLSTGSRVHGLQDLQLSSCNLVALQHMGSFQIRDRTRVSCIDRQILYHWAAREAHWGSF